MEIHQLRYFVAVLDTGSFSRAAEACHVAQPSLSQQIKKLETSLGQTLFDRLPRGAAPTEAGAALEPIARRILDEVQGARSIVQGDLEAGVGPLAVGAIPTMAPFLLPPILARFRAEFPDCELSVREDLTERLLEAVAHHELDCAVMSTPIDHPLVGLEVLGDERLLLATARDFVLPSSVTPTLAALEDQPTIVLHEMHCLGQQIEGFCSSRGMRRRIVCRSTQLSTVRRLVALGLGVSILPEMAARYDGSESVRYVPVEDRGDAGEGPRRTIAVVWHRDRSRSRLARRFVELLREDLDKGEHCLRTEEAKGDAGREPGVSG